MFIESLSVVFRAFTGKVNNSGNIGKTRDEIVYMWNQAHPEDMIIFAAEPEPQPF